MIILGYLLILFGWLALFFFLVYSLGHLWYRYVILRKNFARQLYKWEKVLFRFFSIVFQIFAKLQKSIWKKATRRV